MADLPKLKAGLITFAKTCTGGRLDKLNERLKENELPPGLPSNPFPKRPGVNSRTTSEVTTPAGSSTPEAADHEVSTPHTATRTISQDAPSISRHADKAVRARTLTLSQPEKPRVSPLMDGADMPSAPTARGVDAPPQST